MKNTESLVSAGEKAVIEVGGALVELNKAAIKSPETILSAGRAYDAKINRVIEEWNQNWREWADDDLAKAYLSGIRQADMEMKAVKPKSSPTAEISLSMPLAKKFPLLVMKDIPKGVLKDYAKHITFYNTFRSAAYSSLERTSVQIIRAARDLHRDVAVMAGEKLYKEADVYTRRRLSQSMLDDYAKRGLQSITYTDGRRVSLDVYAETVGRTMTAHTSLQASLNRYEEYGDDLVRVSSHFRACDLCTPWENRVLSQSGSGKYPSLDDAVNAGLFHVNCLHSLSPFYPGVSPKQLISIDPNERALIEEHGYSKAQELTYNAQQKQRYIERNIREWKRRETVALDTVAQNSAHRKVLDWQSAQRGHISENPFLKRDYVREQIKKAH